MSSSERITLTITLADGTSHSETVARLPRSWKSWLMRRMPYGTIFTGASFSLTRTER